MNKTFWQSAKPHLIAILVFLAVSVFFCLPAFQGKVVNQHDIVGWKGMAQQSFEFKEKHGHFPLWTQSTFSGMPAFQIALDSKYKISIDFFHHVFTGFLPDPAGLFFLSCIGFYILGCVLGLRPFVAIFGAIGYAFASYNSALTVAGHLSKLASMGYTPAVLAGLVLLTQRKYLTGFISLLVFSTLLIAQNHLQIVYYTLLIAVCLGIAYLVWSIRKKKLKELFIAGSLAVGATLMAGLACAAMMLPTYEYAKETMRSGRSELSDPTKKDIKTKGGLDKDYAFDYSVGIGETMTIILPRFKGGSSGAGELPEDSKVVEAMQDAGLPAEAQNYFFPYLSAYWGEQPGVGGTVYFGALVCVLFLAGIVFVRNWHAQWIIAAAAVGFVLAWGSNLKAINYFLFDYLPFYNKFRAPSIAMVIPQLMFCLLASMTLQELFYKEGDKKLLLKRLKTAGILAGLVLVILIYNYFGASFKSSGDSNLRNGLGQMIAQVMGQGQQPSEQALQQGNAAASAIINGLAKDRQSLYGGDLVRTIVFVLLGAILVWLGVQRKLKADYLLIGFLLLNLIDLIPVDRRYLKDSSYVEKDEMLAALQPTAADLQIKQDQSYYRVFDQTGDPFQSSNSTARCSYNHNSVGGYHPAKLALYQDLITHQLSKGNMAVFNMLNTKYFIGMNPSNNQLIAQQNPDAAGPAWFVKTIRYVNNADEEMKALDNIKIKDTVVIDKREQHKVAFAPQSDSTATITFGQNLNDKLTYTSNASTNQFAVFSEVYYPHGWKAYIDGKEAPIVKVDYLLRGLSVPAGKHNIEFRFEPRSKAIGDLLSMIIGVLSWILILAAVFLEWRRYQRQQQPAKQQVKAG